MQAMRCDGIAFLQEEGKGREGKEGKKIRLGRKSYYHTGEISRNGMEKWNEILG